MAGWLALWAKSPAFTYVHIIRSTLYQPIFYLFSCYFSHNPFQHTKVFGIEEVLKTDNTENGSDNTKDDDSENPKKKLEDILNTYKEIYE